MNCQVSSCTSHFEHHRCLDNCENQKWCVPLLGLHLATIHMLSVTKTYHPHVLCIRLNSLFIFAQISKSWSASIIASLFNCYANFTTIICSLQGPERIKQIVASTILHVIFQSNAKNAFLNVQNITRLSNFK